MKLDLYFNSVNDYPRAIGAPIFHPHVSIIHYDEVGEIPHTLNRFNVFSLFLQKEFPENLTYGIGTYTEGEGSLLAYGPGQIGGKLDNGTRRQYHGWVLMFDATFIRGTAIERRMPNYHFFSYNANEALILTADEKSVLYGLMNNIRDELSAHREEASSDDIVKDYILLILDYCNRFYVRQFKERSMASNDLLTRLEQLLTDYYRREEQRKQGVPSVKYCASELCLSPGYLGDLLRNAIGQSPKDYIRDFVVRRAKSLILSGQNVSQVAEELGFEYPQHFTRLFKNSTGLTPSQFLDEQLKK